MKIILILVGFILMTGNLNAKPSWDEKVVAEYHKVGGLLMYGTYSNREEYPDAEKYLLKAINYMKKEKMDMNSFEAADIYNSLGHIYSLLSNFSMFDNASELNKDKTEFAIKNINESIMYLELSYKIKKNLGKGYEDTTADTKAMLNEKQALLQKLQKRLSTF